MGAARAATDVCEACWGHLGDKKSCLGMVPKLLTDARETSYWILSSLLTAECSTVELPGNCATSLFSLGFILLHRANSCHDLSVGKQVLSSRGLCAHALQPIVLSRAYGCYVPTPSLRWAVHYGPTRRFR